MIDIPWWDPERFSARRGNLAGRMAVLDAIRGFFRAQDFAKVETPALQVSPGLEPHLRAFATELDEPFRDGPRARLYLHTSPEFAMKKLLVAGEPRIYQIAKCYRNGERSATHHPEFTMLEWYRAEADYRELMGDCETLLRDCLAAVPASVFRRGERSCDPTAPWQYVSVDDAFTQYAKVDLLATTVDARSPNKEALLSQANQIGVWTNENDSWEDVFFRIFLEKIEPHLGVGAPTILFDYPISMAALSRPSPTDGRVCERFELYVCGLELANAFSELTDAAEQRRRFDAERALKQSLGGDVYPIDEDFMAALEHGMPPSAGIALGVDRLAMLATGAAHIDDVLWAPVTKAT
jgi:elongation factor P--(R)-beta-lysine ligase